MPRILTILFLLISMRALASDGAEPWIDSGLRHSAIVTRWNALTPEERKSAQSLSGIVYPILNPEKLFFFSAHGNSAGWIEDDDWGPNFSFQPFPRVFTGYRDPGDLRIRVRIDPILVTPLWRLIHVRITYFYLKMLEGMRDLNITVIERRSIEFIRIHNNQEPRYNSVIANSSSPIVEP